VAGFLGGRLVSGSDLVLEVSRLAEHLAAGADLVLTGEGEINRQTVLGKAPGAVGRLAARYGVAVVAVVGARGPGYEEVYRQGIGAVYSIVPRPMSLAEALVDAERLLEEGVAELMRVWRLGGLDG
jgi:glycerate kinase